MSASSTPRVHKRSRSDDSVEIVAVRNVRRRGDNREPEPPQLLPPPPPVQEQEEEERLRAFRDTEPRWFAGLWQRATTELFFLLKRRRCDTADYPQEDFDLAGDTGNVYSIRVGRVPSCNCDAALRGHQCKPVIFILHHILKVPYHLTYQLALLDSELRQIYENLPEPSISDGRNDEDDAKRKPIEGDCPICFVALDPQDGDSIVWCRTACGQNLHRHCFDQWARGCDRNADDVTCPLCRGRWDEEGLEDVDTGLGTETSDADFDTDTITETTDIDLDTDTTTDSEDEDTDEDLEGGDDLDAFGGVDIHNNHVGGNGYCHACGGVNIYDDIDTDEDLEDDGDDSGDFGELNIYNNDPDWNGYDAFGGVDIHNNHIGQHVHLTPHGADTYINVNGRERHVLRGGHGVGRTVINVEHGNGHSHVVAHGVGQPGKLDGETVTGGDDAGNG